VDDRERERDKERGGENETDAFFIIRHWIGPNDTHKARTPEYVLSLGLNFEGTLCFITAARSKEELEGTR
jgi:hypothetical protein